MRMVGSKKAAAEERILIKNGGMLLEKLIGSWNGRCTPIRNFSAKELQNATNNYDPAVNVFSEDSHSIFKWYKGSIEGRIVSIKKYEYFNGKDADYYIDEAINDIVRAAQLTAHNNILKLIGCCLEAECPIAVYDFAENGTLSSNIHIYGKNPPPQPLLWESRLRIATEIASAVAYLHTAFRTPVIHRDLHSSNVYLDEHNVVKLSCFEVSIALPEGETQVKEDRLFETYGYLAPEYATTGLVSEKIDVYNFGAILKELLTGRNPTEFVDGECVSSRFVFRTHTVSNEENQILDPTILEEEVGRIDVQQQVRAMSELALKCMKENPEERPIMLDVARQLLQLKTTIVDHN